MRSWWTGNIKEL